MHGTNHKEAERKFPNGLSEEDVLLIDDSYISLYPTLALSLGLNAAIVLDTLDNLLQNTVETIDGHKWIRQTYEKWQANYFPFWSTKTIQRTMLKLEKEGYIITMNTYNRNLKNRTKWYRINYDKMNQLV